MSQTDTERFPFSEVFHVGIIVKDMDKAVKTLSALGIGPFEPYHTKLGVVPPVERKLRGKPVDCSMKVLSARIGPIDLELIEPEGECIQTEFLAEKGEGLHHLAFFVDDLDHEKAKLAAKGLQPIMEGTMAKGSYFAYYEIKELGGLVMELLQRPGK